MKRCSSGNAIAEYGLFGTLLVLATAALTVLGNGISNLLESASANSSTSVNAYFSVLGPAAPVTKGGSQASSGKPGTSPAASSLSLPALPVDGVGTMTITMPDGLVINLEDYPKDVTAVVQSTGANGATTLLANQLTSLTVLLAEHGVITGEEATGLLELANQGHRIALIERTIEEAYKVSADPAAFAKQPINFEGVVYDSPSDLADLIGEDSADSRDHVERIKFQTLYDKVANSLATREPAVQTLVNDLVRDIINIAESVEASSEEDNYDPAQYQNNIASNATDKDSTQICKLGGNNSGDKFCLR